LTGSVERNQNGSESGTKPDLPPHPWPEGAEKLYQESLEASLVSAMLMSSPSPCMREAGFAEWARSDFLAREAIRLTKPPSIFIINVN
jgi:hypothetical protein